jgi:hypothetical protein
MRVLRKFAVALLVSSVLAQSPALLPPNYKPILNNADVLVQRVHYGPHEFVPMHDHPAVTTVYVYLNNSGVVDIAHDGGSTVHRPPTHAGAFRVSPGAFERHSVQNTSDLPSDFLRIELKRLPVDTLPAEFRGAAPKEPFQAGTETAYDNPALRIERTVCGSDERCTVAPEDAPSVLVLVPLNSKSEPRQNPITWLPANEGLKDGMLFEWLDEPREILRIILPMQ